MSAYMFIHFISCNHVAANQLVAAASFHGHRINEGAHMKKSGLKLMKLAASHVEL